MPSASGTRGTGESFSTLIRSRRGGAACGRALGSMALPAPFGLVGGTEVVPP